MNRDSIITGMLTMRDGYTIREYRVGDEKEINDLFNLVFKQNRSLNEWYWQFRDNPAGSANLIAVAEVTGRIVGQHANVPVYFKFKDKIVKAGQPVDNLIHPSFRGGKSIKDTYKLSCYLYVREGMTFGFGFPNEIYYPVGKKLLKYEDLCPLPTMFKRLSWRLPFKKKFPMLPSYLQLGIQKLSMKFYRLPVILKGLSRRTLSLERLSFLGSDMDRLWEKAKDRYGIMAIRDYRFLKWRYLDKPDGPYDILLAQDGNPLGYVVAKVTRKEEHLVGYIVDILSIDKTVDNFLIGTTLNYFISKKVDYSLCRILREDEVYNILLDYGFRENEAFPSTPVVYQIFDNEVDCSFFKNLRNWHLTYGDQIDVSF